MDSVSIGFEIPVVGLFVGLAVLGVGLFLDGQFGSGLNPVTYAGIGLGFLSIVALLLAVTNAPEEADAEGH